MKFLNLSIISVICKVQKYEIFATTKHKTGFLHLQLLLTVIFCRALLNAVLKICYIYFDVSASYVKFAY